MTAASWGRCVSYAGKEVQALAAKWLLSCVGCVAAWACSHDRREDWTPGRHRFGRSAAKAKAAKGAPPFPVLAQSLEMQRPRPCRSSLQHSRSFNSFTARAPAQAEPVRADQQPFLRTSLCCAAIAIGLTSLRLRQSPIDDDDEKIRYRGRQYQLLAAITMPHTHARATKKQLLVDSMISQN